MFRPSRSSSGPSRTQNQALFSVPALWDPKCYKFQLREQKVYKLAGKLNNAGFCVFEGPEDDLLGRNMSP